MKHRTRNTEQSALTPTPALNNAEPRDNKRRSDLVVVMTAPKIELPTLGPGARAVNAENLLHRAVRNINTYFQYTQFVRTSEIEATEADKYLLVAEKCVVQALDLLEVASASLVGRERREELRKLRL